jgi:hypothetical protein
MPLLERLRQKDYEFQASLDYIVRSFLKNTMKNKKIFKNE